MIAFRNHDGKGISSPAAVMHIFMSYFRRGQNPVNVMPTWAACIPCLLPCLSRPPIRVRRRPCRVQRRGGGRRRTIGWRSAICAPRTSTSPLEIDRCARPGVKLTERLPASDRTHSTESALRQSFHRRERAAYRRRPHAQDRAARRRAQWAQCNPGRVLRPAPGERRRGAGGLRARREYRHGWAHDL